MIEAEENPMVHRLFAALLLAGLAMLQASCSKPRDAIPDPTRGLPLEALYAAQRSGQDSFSIEQPLPTDEATGKPRRVNLTIWCADQCLKHPGGDAGETPEESRTYVSALERARENFTPKAREILASGDDDAETTRRLGEALRKSWAEAGVYDLLRTYMARELPKVDCCMRRCVETRLKVLAPWQKLITVTTSDDEDLESHIVVDPEAPSLPEEFRRAGRALEAEPRFLRCLAESIRRFPPFPEMVSGLDPGSRPSRLKAVRRGIWIVWEKTGVPPVVAEAAKENPDPERITSLIDACLSGNGTPPANRTQ